jgi:hypothetical protein
MREMYTDRLVGTINGRNIARICGEDVYCLGAEKISQVAKIQGMSVKYCYGDEIAKWNPEIFAMLQSRLDKPYSMFDGSCNPESPNHWLKEFIETQVTREDDKKYYTKQNVGAIKIDGHYYLIKKPSISNRFCFFFLSFTIFIFIF